MPSRTEGVRAAAVAALGRGGGIDLAGQTILVTGSTDGIGQHTALRLAAAGATVLLHGRSQQRVDAAAERARDAARGAAGAADAGGRIHTYVADLSDLRQVRRLAAAVRDDHPGGIHTLINNAGVYCESPSRRAATWVVFRLSRRALNFQFSSVLGPRRPAAHGVTPWNRQARRQPGRRARQAALPNAMLKAKPPLVSRAQPSGWPNRLMGSS